MHFDLVKTSSGSIYFSRVEYFKFYYIHTSMQCNACIYLPEIVMCWLRLAPALARLRLHKAVGQAQVVGFGLA